MFFLLAIISTVAYALHGVWMTPYYRRVDQMVAVTARGFASVWRWFRACWFLAGRGWFACPANSLGF